MSKGSRSPLFPVSQQDVSRLRQSATDAVSDISETATSHVGRVGGQLRDLAGHIQEEGGQNIRMVRGKVSDAVSLAQDFVTDRPLVCLGAALAIGIVIGLSRRRNNPA